MSHTPKIPGILNGVTTIQTNVSTLQTDVDTVESNITTLQTDVDTVESNITTLQTDVDTVESNITTLQSDVSTLQTNSTEDQTNSTETFTNTYSLSFDGTDDYVSTSSSIGGSQYSVSLWINFPSINHQSYIVHSSTYQLRMRTDGPWLQYAGYDQIKPSQQYTAISLSVDTWHHLVTTHDGSHHIMYLNGSLLGERASGNTIPSSSSVFKIGGYSSRSWIGKIDEFSTYNSTLSASDVTSIYNNGVPGDLSSLSPVYWYRMGDNDNGTGTTITDQGSGSSDLTLYNGPTFSTTVPS